MPRSPALNVEDANRIARLKTRLECIQFSKNIEAPRPDLAIAARRHAIELQLNERGLTDPLLRDIWGAVYAYEEVLYLKHKKHVKAHHTRQAIENHGEIEGVETIVLSPETKGFERMQDAGLLNRTFEFVVLRHPECFKPPIVTIASQKLKPWLDKDGSGEA